MKERQRGLRTRIVVLSLRQDLFFYFVLPVDHATYIAAFRRLRVDLCESNPKRNKGFFRT